MDGDTVYEAALQAWPPWGTDTLQNRKVAASAGVSARWGNRSSSRPSRRRRCCTAF